MENKRCVFVGVGGQGNLLASRLLGEALLSMGVPVVVSEIHGMAQRGGIVESSVVTGNITSPIVSEGEADILVGFEPVETARAIGKCNRQTLVITNTHPLPPFTVSLGQGKYPSVDELLDKIQAKVERVIALDGDDLAQDAGNPLSLNIVMLGALIGSKALPVPPEKMNETIGIWTQKAFLDSNLKAFDLGMKAARG